MLYSFVDVHSPYRSARIFIEDGLDVSVDHGGLPHARVSYEHDFDLLTVALLLHL